MADADDPSSNARLTSHFNQSWLDAVVSIERIGKEGTAKSIGTGFLVRGLVGPRLLVTAAHVVFETKNSLVPKLVYRRSGGTGGSDLITEDELMAMGVPSWFRSQSCDLACRYIGWKKPDPSRCLTKDLFLPLEMAQTGAPALVLGYPLGLRSRDHSRPIARHAMVARIDSDSMIIDTFVFPGNSGGPVVYVPTIKFGGGITSALISRERLLGVVRSYISHSEEAVSSETGRTRVWFEHNAGLADVIPADRLTELMAREDVQKAATEMAEPQHADSEST